MRTLRPYPAIPGWGVWCVCSGTGVPHHLWLGCLVRVCVLASAHQSWLGCWGVCVCVRSQPVPRQSWLKSAVPVCGFPFSAFTPRILAGVLGRVFLCARAACTPPVLAGVCVVGVCARVRVSAAPRHSWLGCSGFCLCVPVPLDPANPGWGVGACVTLWALRPYPTNHCWGSWCICVGPGLGLHPADPGWGVGVCVFVCVLPLYPAKSGWGVLCGCPCLGSGFGCWGVCVCVCAPPVARQS